MVPPDRRKRDLDNLLKSLLDGLEGAGVFKDDAQIDDLQIVRRPSDKDCPYPVLVVIRVI